MEGGTLGFEQRGFPLSYRAFCVGLCVCARVSASLPLSGSLRFVLPWGRHASYISPS